MSYVRSKLYVIELLAVNGSRQTYLTRIPAHFVMLELAVQVVGEPLQAIHISVAAHETDASYTASDGRHHLVNGSFVELFADILPQILTVTAWAMVWTVGYVY